MAARLFRPGLFTNKVNIITGGGSGIGFGIAQDCFLSTDHNWVDFKGMEPAQKILNDHKFSQKIFYRKHSKGIMSTWFKSCYCIP